MNSNYYDHFFGTVITTPEIAREFKEQLPEWVIILPVTNEDLFNLTKKKLTRERLAH